MGGVGRRGREPRAGAKAGEAPRGTDARAAPARFQAIFEGCALRGERRARTRQSREAGVTVLENQAWGGTPVQVQDVVFLKRTIYSKTQLF